MIRQLRKIRTATALLTLAVLAMAADYAAASGWPPFAGDDSATVKRGATVSVLDSGATSVLANDFDFEGDPLTVILVREPRYGELDLAEDGTFTYRHNGASRRNDRFDYQAFDGTSYSRQVRVTIDVIRGVPIAPEIIDQRDVAVDEDASVQIELDDLVVTDPDSSYPRDFTLEVGDGDNYSRAGAVVTPSRDYNGVLSVPVRVFDGTNFSNEFSLRVNVRPRNDPPTTTGNVADQEALEGERFSLALAGRFDDIDAGDRLRFSASGLPPSGSMAIDADSGVLSGTPVRADATDDPYTVTVTATDTGGRSASLSFSLVVFPDNRADLAVEASVSKNPTLLGEPSKWSITISNQGPAALEQGELVSTWTTAGAPLDLSAPSGCTVSANNSVQPSVTCPLSALAVGEALVIDVEGIQQADGDNTVVVNAVADDPVNDNNAARVSAQVAAAFSDGPAERIDASAAALAAADFDADGLPDLAVLGDELAVYRNTGERRFAATGTILPGAGTHVIALDWNGDGVPDLASADAASGSVAIHAADGAGTFAEPLVFSSAPANSIAAMAAADLDRDGFEEIVIVAASGTLLARNAGDGGVRVEQVSGIAGIDLAAADFTGDGATDVALIPVFDRSIELLANDGSGGLVAAGSFEVGAATSLAAADLDADGVTDLMVAIDDSGMGAPYTQILKGTGDGTFTFYETLGASSASELLAGDVDSDGYADVVVVNAAGVHQVYRGDAAGAFTLSDEQIVSDGMSAGLLLDVYSDDSLDLVIAGREVGAIEVHANNGIGRLGLGDVVPPDIVLQGEPAVSIPAGGTFTDPGATATDDIDGDLTSEIVVSGAVDTTVVGTYTLTYAVSDRASNTSQVSRSVKVGVNAGTGGGGGGSLSLFAILGLLLASTRRSRGVACETRTRR